MKTRIVRIDPLAPEAAIVEEAASVLKSGGLVAVPTETVYGLAANALDAAAVRGIFVAKGRPSVNPVIVHAADQQRARSLFAEWPQSADRLAGSFWPGPLTLVLRRSSLVPDVVTGGGGTVGVRVPNHAVTLALIQSAGVPIAAPSANRSQQISPTTADHVWADLDGRINLILDAGPTSGGIESTVVDLTDDPIILRPGPITRARLEVCLGRACGHAEHAINHPHEPFRSPGLQQRHYAPRTKLECTLDAAARVAELSSLGQQVGWLTLGGLDECTASVSHVVEMPREPVAYGRLLYAELHRMDELDLDLIVVSMPPDDDAWAAVRDRLRRASS